MGMGLTFETEYVILVFGPEAIKMYPLVSASSPYGDGFACRRIAEILSHAVKPAVPIICQSDFLYES